MKNAFDFVAESLVLGGVFTWLDYVFSRTLGVEEG